ncbi:beta-N-acetylglucosaminidase domain-containing protein [Paenibacillus sp. FSL K6-2859]|uniref:beta-N-acetylglucosaminidase domain-containing protein n=1 Tax=Paenibacillus sp. FSL K6-2859 TaxID=2921482 RepID=UPI0030F517FE
MPKKILSIFITLMMVAGLFSSFAAAADVASDLPEKDAKLTESYEIYPLPQQQTEEETTLTITQNVNVVIEDSIDQPTRKLLQKILDSKSLQVTESGAVVAGKTNIFLGTKNSSGYVDNYFTQNIPYEADHFNELDAYVLNVSTKQQNKGVIAILGKNTDAAYYGLATLKMIFNQIPDLKVRNLTIEDFSDTRSRGFIEGFYGTPWSHEDRMSLMRFGGELKMNTYIFAPKDDKYHNAEWRTPYPAAELAKIKELVDVGHESKTQFVWAIHPGFNMINWNNYNAELQTLLAKLEQLYSVGVRQFGLFMDDISTSQSLVDKDKHVKLITDVANWVTSKKDVKSLIYCPPYYNKSWTGTTGRPYLEALKNVPENVDIMWTGNGVVASVNAADMQWPKDAHGRDPYMWLNWPVNDYKDARLLLGKAEVLIPGTHNISGVVTNPMKHAELSKIGIFAVADYTWNVDDFEQEESWLDSFKHVAPEVASELNTIAYHMSDPSPSGHGLVVGESENIKTELTQFLSQYSSGQPTETTGNTLIQEFDLILDAIASFRVNNTNENMEEEIDPWLNSLQNVVLADKSAVLSAIAIQKENVDQAWEALAKATSALSLSKTFKISKLNSPDVTVEAGAKRLVPFAEQLINKLDAQIYTLVDPEYVKPLAVSSYGSPSGLNLMVDGDLATNVYIQTLQQNGDWYGVDFGKTIKVEEIAITQGRTDADHDIFQRGILEYSVNGQEWTAIGEERSGYKISASGLSVNARMVRYRLTHAGIPGGKPDLWTAVREFSVNAGKDKVAIYTDVTELKDTPVMVADNSVQLSNMNGITLKPSQYVGINLKSIEEITQVVLEASNGEVRLESSKNGVEWEQVNNGNGAFASAAYFRIINKGNENITVDLTRLMIKLNKFSPPMITHNYGSIYEGSINNVYNASLENKVWFGAIQAKGKYVQIDMGGEVNVQNVAVVIGDGEGDFFRKGDLQLSLDGQTWDTIHTFTNPSDRSLNFPEHEVPYRYKRVQVDGGKQARYVRLISTETQDAWLALNEILVNEGIERPGTANPAIQAEPAGVIGNEASLSVDQKLSTFYMPGTGNTGSLNYKLSKDTRVKEVIVLQNPSDHSNAAVSVRDASGWHKVGNLSSSYNTFDTSKYSHVFEVKIQWEGSTKPKIHEIITVKKDGNGEVDPSDKMTSVLSGVDTVAGGKDFQLVFGVKSVTDAVYAMDVTMNYDPKLLEFKSATSLRSGIQVLETANHTPGKLRLLVVSEGVGNAVTGNLQLLSLDFGTKTVAEATESIIQIEKVIVADAEGKESETVTSSHKLKITAEEPEPGMTGDINKDGKVSIGDLAIVAANYGKDTNSPDWAEAKRADVNKDGVINLNDLALVARKITE